MSTKRRIVVAGLDTCVRSIVNDCLPSDHFDIAEFDEHAIVASTCRLTPVSFGKSSTSWISDCRWRACVARGGEHG